MGNKAFVDVFSSFHRPSMQIFLSREFRMLSAERYRRKREIIIQKREKNERYVDASINQLLHHGTVIRYAHSVEQFRCAFSACSPHVPITYAYLVCEFRISMEMRIELSRVELDTIDLRIM